MTRTTRYSLAPLLLLFLSVFSYGQTSDPLPRSTPEAEGVSPQAIMQFLEAAGKSKHEFHSYMVLRHGKVIAEGWWHPYRPDLRHTMYSVSKSFTATAIGFAVDEKRLTVQDKVISFFPNDLPATISPYLAQLTVRDLLSMSAGQDPDPTPIVGRDSNWVRSFLATPIAHAPGSKFLYNSLCTYMLSAIVQKVSGEKVIDYLQARLFVPLGISNADWETDPQGINVGGWGLRIKTEDMAKFGQLFLQKGVWKGQQLLPTGWVEEASTLKIVQHPELPQAKKDSSDWEQGYCYQMWRCRNNAFRGDGAFGQFIVVMPDQDAVVVITSETSDMQDELNLVWKYLFPALQGKSVASTKKSEEQLSRTQRALKLPVPPATKAPKLQKDLSGKTVALSPNDAFLQSIYFQWNGDVCRLTVKSNSGTDVLEFGSGKWVFGETKKLGPSLVKRAKGHFAGLPPAKIAGAYRWSDARTLELTLRYIESPHTETYRIQFDQNQVSVRVQSSFEKNAAQELKGLLSQVMPNPVRLIVRGDDMGIGKP